METIRRLAATLLLVAAVAVSPCFAGVEVESRLASLGTPDRDGGFAPGASLDLPNRACDAAHLRLDDAFGWTVASRIDQVEQQAEAEARALAASHRPCPAVSLDRRVPAAQPTDPEGVTLIGVAGVVGELRHAFTAREREPARGGVMAQVARTLRESVFGKRISVLSESGRIAENDPFLVGVSFTH
jgi:hypothetical protein